jgi:hypothetical protein
MSICDQGLTYLSYYGISLALDTECKITVFELETVTRKYWDEWKKHSNHLS